MADRAEKRRVVRAQQVELADTAEFLAWIPSVLKGDVSLSSLPMRLKDAVPRETQTPQKSQAEVSQKPEPIRVQQRAEAESLKQPPIRPDESLEQIAERRPQDVARAIQTILYTEDDKKHRELGILMIGLGAAIAAGVLQHCSAEDVSIIAKVVAECQTVTVQEKEVVFEAFQKRLFDGEYVLQGGASFARMMLYKAVGPRKAEMMMARLDVDHDGGFQLLRDVEPEQLVPFLAKEHPQTIALVLTQMEAAQAAGVLNRLDATSQGEVTHRIAQMNTVSPQAMRELEDSLSSELRALLSGQITELGGPISVANILNQTGRSTEKHVLANLDEHDPDLAEKVRNRMFVFDDIANLTDREIQTILKEVDIKDLAIGLKGGSKELRERIFKNVSEEVGSEIKEKMEFSGPVRVSDVEEVQLRIVKVVRKLDDSGKVTIVRSGLDPFI